MKEVQMMGQLIEKEVSAAKHAVEAVREWLHHRKTVMKEHAFDRPLDDLGQTIDDLDRRAEPSGPGSEPTRARDT
jgi:hypothetical protein